MNKDSDKTKEQLIAELAALRQKSQKQEDKLKAANQQLEAQNQQLRVSETRMRNLFNAMQDLVLEMDYNGTYLNIAPTSSQFLVKPAEEVIGKTLHDVFPKPQADLFLQFIQKCIDENKADKIIYPIKFDNKTIWIEGRANPIGNKRVLYIASDITERKQAEEKLKESELKFQKITDESFSGITVVNEEGKIMVWNKAQEKISGIKKTQTINRYIWDVEVELIDRETVGENRREEIKSTVLKALKTGKAPWLNKTVEYEHSRSDGTVKIVSRRMYTIKTQKGYLIVAMSDDITERKQQEKALMESELRLKTLINATPDIICFKDGKGRWLVANDADIELFSLQNTDYFGKTDAELAEFTDPIYKESFLLCMETDEKAWQLKTLFRNNEVIPTVNGTKKVYDVIKVPLFEPDGSRKGLVVLGRDISKRKQAENKLKESEEKYRTIFESAKDAIFIMQGDRFIDCNKKTLEMFECHREDIIGKFPYNYSPEKQPDGRASQKKSIDKINKALAGEPQLFEWVHATKHGKPFYTLVTLNRYMINDEIFLMAIVRDITERKRAEEALQRSETLFRAITEQSGEGISLADTNGNYVKVNSAFCKITGYSEEELLTMNIRDLVPPETEVKLFPQVRKRKSGKREAVLRRKDGSHFVAEINGYPIQLINQNLGLGIVRDITERKQAEENLKLALEKAQESDRLKSAFLANMSHEIRTPMNAILGFTELLKEPQLTGDEKDEYVRIIEKSGHRLLDTINDIIDISKIEAGQVKVTETEVSVNEILKEHYHLFYHEAESKGIELNYEPSLSDREARLITDKQKLEGILTNLIKNAIKFTEKGNITFGYDIVSVEDKKYLEFYVKDTGIGIPADRVEAIFNRFEQADMGDTRVFEGSGLGLAISKSYVEMLGGKISVKSKPGEGSTFIFSIPYHRQNLKEGSASQNNKEESGVILNNLSIIVAEDDEINKLFYENILKNNFKKIIYTTSGKETIEKFRENPDTDIILMDIKMPDMNGYDATREIRKFNNDVIIVAQTAFGLAGDRKKAIEAGCNDYIAKPVKKEILFNKIQACLNKKSV